MHDSGPGRLLAIDYGRARIGLAICDELGISIEELGFIPREHDQQAAEVLAAVAAEQAATGLVIGMPLNADGSSGINIQWVRRFVKLLDGLCDLPIAEVDERYSSSEAEASLREEGRWPAKPGAVDARAAAIILRRHLAGES